MYAINEKLALRHAQGNPVRASLIGAGQMGTDILAQADQMKGFVLPVVVDLSFERLRAAFAIAAYSRTVVYTDDRGEAEDAVRDGATVATTDSPARHSGRQHAAVKTPPESTCARAHAQTEHTFPPHWTQTCAATTATAGRAASA